MPTKKLLLRMIVCLVAVGCLVILAEPIMMAVYITLRGNVVSSIDMDWGETDFHLMSTGSDPAGFEFITIPSVRVMLWGLASFVLLFMTAGILLRWMIQTRAITAFDRSKAQILGTHHE